jgi:hypothetical protein
MEFSCTEEEFRIFESIVEQDMIGSFAFYLELVLLGMKPGTCPAHKNELEIFREELEQMGVHIKRIKLEFVDLDELPEYATELEYDKPYFVARDPERLEMLKDVYREDEEDQYDRDFALFLGYPGEDVEWFVGEGEDQYEKSKKELGEPEDFDEIIQKVMYVPKPTEEAYERARKTAEKYVKALKQADEKFDSDVGDKLIEVQCDR